MVLCNAESGAGGGSPPPADGGTPPAGDPPPSDPWKRDFLPDSVYGASPEETFGKLADAWKGLREGESKRPQAGKNADEYAFDASKNEKLAPYFQNADADPFLKMAREVAHKVGMPKEHFGAFVTQLFEGAVDAKLLGPVYSPEAEARALADRLAPGKSWAEAKPVVVKAHADATGFADVLGQQLQLGDGAKGLLSALVDEADGVELLNALANSMKQVPGFALPGVKGGESGGWTKEKLDAAVTDPRYSPYSAQHDKAWRESVDAGMRQFYGN